MEFVAEGLHAAEAECSALDLARGFHEISTSSVSSRSSPSSFSSASPINLPQSSPAPQNPLVHHYADVNNVTVIAYQSSYSTLDRQQAVLYAPYPSTIGVPVVNNKRNPPSVDSALNPLYGEGITSNVHAMPIGDLAMGNGVRPNQYTGYYPLHESLVTYTSNYQQHGPMQSAGPDLYGGSNGPALQNSLPPFSACTFSSLIHAPATNNNNLNFVNQNFDTTHFDQDLFKTPYSDHSSKPQKRKLSSPNDSPTEDSPVFLGELSPPCSVCGDVGSGIHYGVWACEGCKGFFRRAALRNPQDPGFTCFYRSECDVNRENRNKCRACRLRRCQEAGMVYGASLKDIQKKRRELSHPTAFSVVTSRSNVQQLTESIVTAHIASFTSVSEVFTSRYAAVLSLGPDQLWPPGADLSQRGIQAVQLFAQSLPFLNSLPQELFTVLMAQNAIDIMLLRVTFRFCIERDSFLFPPGAEVTLPCLSATQIGSQTTNRLAALGRCVNRLGMGSEDLAFLSALILLSSDNVDNSKLLSSHTDTLNDTRARVLGAFDWYVHQRVSIGPVQTGKMIAFLADVRAVELSVPIQTWLDPAKSLTS